MQTKQQHIEYHHKSAFIPCEDKDTLIKALWLVLKTCFYPGISYSPREQRAIYRVLGILFHGTSSSYETYVKLCESVLLVAGYARACRPGIAIIHLLAWLNQPEPKLAANCPLRYDVLEQQRQSNRLLHIEWKYLADAVLSCLEDGVHSNSARFIQWFSENGHAEELRIYLSILRDRSSKDQRL